MGRFLSQPTIVDLFKIEPNPTQSCVGRVGKFGTNHSLLGECSYVKRPISTYCYPRQPALLFDLRIGSTAFQTPLKVALYNIKPSLRRSSFSPPGDVIKCVESGRCSTTSHNQILIFTSMSTLHCSLLKIHLITVVIC